MGVLQRRSESSGEKKHSLRLLETSPKLTCTVQLLQLLYVISKLWRFSVCFGDVLSLTLHFSCRHTSLRLWFANVLNYMCFVLSRTLTFLEASVINTLNTHTISTLVLSISYIYDTCLSVLIIHSHCSNIHRHFIPILLVVLSLNGACGSTVGWGTAL